MVGPVVGTVETRRERVSRGELPLQAPSPDGAQGGELVTCAGSGPRIHE
jgi:hypothetical protein